MGLLRGFRTLIASRREMHSYLKSYSITVSVTNGSYVGPEEIEASGTSQITITPSEGYVNPESITVVGAEYTYDSHSGVIGLSNPTSDIIITVVCEEVL